MEDVEEEKFEPVYPWRYTAEVLRQSHRIREEARQAVAQARAEQERARKLIKEPLPPPAAPEAVSEKDITPQSER
jgi:hypothetical protein